MSLTPEWKSVISDLLAERDALRWEIRELEGHILGARGEQELALVQEWVRSRQSVSIRAEHS